MIYRPKQPNPRPGASLKVAMVEDQEGIRESWAQLIDSFDGFRCVCLCPSGEEALRLIPAAQPDIVVMDIFLPRMSGIECTARLKALLPQTRIIVLTASDDEELVFPALEAGADGYLVKEVEPAELEAALLDLAGGGAPITSGIARRVVEFFRERAKVRGEVVHLSAREQEVLLMLARGYSNKEIAGELLLTVETIRGYVKQVYEKMHVRSRAQAVAKYLSLKQQ